MNAFLKKFSRIIDKSSDRLLVERAKLGDKQAFARLYEKYLDAIYRYIYFKVGQDQMEAEDQTQKVFMKSWEQLATFDSRGGTFQAWIYRIAHNLVVDFYRSQKNTINSVELELIPDEKNLEAEVLNRFEVDAVKQALIHLSADQREVISLKYIEDLTNKEICQIMHKKPDAVRALQSRAVRQLQKIVKLKNI